MNKKKTINAVITGIIIGLIGTTVGTILWIVCLSDANIPDTIKNAYQQKLLAPIVSAGALVNLASLFLFLKQKKNNEARGVIIATLLVAVFVVIQKLR